MPVKEVIPLPTYRCPLIAQRLVRRWNFFSTDCRQLPLASCPAGHQGTRQGTEPIARYCNPIIITRALPMHARRLGNPSARVLLGQDKL